MNQIIMLHSTNMYNINKNKNFLCSKSLNFSVDKKKTNGLEANVSSHSFEKVFWILLSLSTIRFYPFLILS